MNAEQLRDAIGKIDDRFIEEAEHYEPETVSIKPIWIITSASAAVIALCTGIHFHNATEHALRPEIDNSVVITTSVSETETYETDVVKTEKHVQISELVTENTEATGMKSGEESSIPYEATVPEKTEATSGNVGSLGEKNVVTQKPQDVTKAPVTETAEIIHELLTVAPGTELTVSPHVDVTTETPTYIETVPVVVPSSTSYPSPIPTPSPCGNPTPIPTPSPHSDPTPSNLPLTSATVFPPVSWEPVSPEYIDKTSDFPAVLKTADGVRYERRLLITKRQAGKFVQTISLSDDKGNDYELSEFSLRYDVSEYSSLNGVSEDQVSVFYFEREDEYLIYVKEP
jgi:hypothetical protein